MAKRPRPATQLTLFPVPSDEALWTKPFTIELLDGTKLQLNLETVRRLRKLEMPPNSLPSADGAVKSTS